MERIKNVLKLSLVLFNTSLRIIVLLTKYIFFIATKVGNDPNYVQVPLTIIVYGKFVKFTTVSDIEHTEEKQNEQR